MAVSETLFKEVNYSLTALLEDIELGEIGLPDIQRPFVWTSAKVRDLLDSMYKGFPVGYLLFWVNGASAGARQIGSTEKQKAPRLLIVDGQQRLTSLYAVFKAQPVIGKDFAPQRIAIAFRPRDAHFEVCDAAISRDPEFIPDISELWAGHMMRKKVVKGFLQRLTQAKGVLDEEVENQLEENIDRLYDLHNYPFTALELSSSVDEERVAEVFVRINSKGTPLNQADFILTLMSVFWDDGRADLERFCRAAKVPSAAGPSPFNYFLQPEPDHLLRVVVALAFRRARLEAVYSVLRGKDLETGQFSEERRILQFGLLAQAQSYALDLQNWHEFMKVLVRAGYRSSSMISSNIGLLYTYAIFLIGKRDFGVDPYVLREVIARWFFASSLTSRYTGSSESVMEEDLARLRSVKDADEFVRLLDGQAATVLTDDFWNITLPNDLATASSRSPSLFAFYAALNLLDARVLFSQMKVSELLDPSQKAKKGAVERHHLFPKNYLKRLGITEVRETNQIANYALVEWADNIAIQDEPPASYFPKYMARFSDSPGEFASMCYWHALPDGWENMTYDCFLSARRKAMALVIRDGFKRLCATHLPSQSSAPVAASSAKLPGEDDGEMAG